MRTALCALLLLLAARQDDLDALLTRLGDDDPETREAAAAELLKRGEPARAALEKAAASDHAELKARAKEILRALDKRREAERVKVEIVLPPDAPTRWDVNAGTFKFTIRYTNGNDHEVVVPVTGTLRLLDKEGGDVPKAFMWGGGTSFRGCLLPVYAGETFRTVAPKQSVDVAVGLDRVPQSLGAAGYRLEAPGEYTVVVTPGYSRDGFLKRCSRGCESHADEKQPWNRAILLPAAPAKGTIAVAQGASIACEKHAKSPGESVVDHSAFCHLDGDKCASCGKPSLGACWKDRHQEPPPTVPMCANCARAKAACAACGK
jgi:hypothetical protein